MFDLLTTKLHIPRPRSDLVRRPRLTARLTAGLDKKLTLIAAPAGFGKTTLLSEWIPQSPRCVTWLSLDEGDNSSARFWAYFIAALQTLSPEIGKSAQDLISAFQAPPIETILTVLINEIDAFEDSFACVLDDYHLIENMEIDQGLTYLIEHQTSNMHLIINTRIDPSLPLHRLRARDNLTEIRAEDMRFTPDEIAAFLAQEMGIDFSAGEVAAMEARTEGWIAGLQIAVLSMRGREDVSAFIRSFSGSHRHILEYLAEEVLSQRPKGTLNFLLRTAVLDRLCGSLCDAVTGGSGGQTILENLEHANLFITPLDDEGRWFRYHHLFAEVLQARLQQQHPELPAELHLRASVWYEDHSLIFEAVQHALAAGSMDQVSRLIESHRWALLGRGDAHTLQRWLDELPDEVVRSRPGLGLAYAWILTMMEQTESIEAYISDVEHALSEAGLPSEQINLEHENALRGEIASLRADIALTRYDLPRAIGLCRQALTLLPEENFLIRGVTTYFLGHGERFGGRVEQAEHAYIEASELALRADNLLIASYALANLANVQIAMGHLSQAARSSRRILEVSSERQRQTWPVAGMAYQGLGKLYYEWNDLDSAEEQLNLGIEYGQRGGLVSLEIVNYSVLILIRQAQGDASGADQMLENIGRLADQSLNPLYTARLPAIEAHLRWRQGHYELAIQWADTCGLRLDAADLPYMLEQDYLTLARIRIAQGKLEGVAEMLARLARAAEADRRYGDLIAILIQLVMAHRALGQQEQARLYVERALKLAEPEGYVRSFVDEGEPMRRLLLDYRASLQNRLGNGDGREIIPLLACTDQLLGSFAPDAPAQKELDEAGMEALNAREMEILQLIATGRSNREIADLLVIAVSTVKWNINNLYGKLGAKSRTHALARARELNLL
jgi:LuxR family maltose regulon positive regulatory protein